MNGEFLFDEDRHEYSVDGKIVPSVTHIIRFLACDVAAGASAAMRDAAAERGSRIHEACTAYDIDGEDAEIDGDIVGYVRAYANFLRDYSIKTWLSFEKPLCSLGVRQFAGTIDRFGMIDGKGTLVDIKTGSKLNMPMHRAQLSGYEILLNDNGFSVEQKAVLHLRRDGAYSFRLAPSKDAEAMQAFMLCRQINNYLEVEK